MTSTMVAVVAVVVARIIRCDGHSVSAVNDNKNSNFRIFCILLSCAYHNIIPCPRIHNELWKCSLATAITMQ